MGERFKRLRTLCWLSALAPGCSGGGEDDATATAGASSAAGSGATANGGAPGSGGSNGGANGGAGATAAPLMPLVPGYRWTFEFDPPWNAASPLPFTCDAPTAEVGRAATIDGRSGVLYMTVCADAPMLVTGTGDALTAFPVLSEGGADESLGEAYEYIHSPVAEGETWMAGGTTYTWHVAPEPLVVPAGSFSKCWERSTSNTSFYYCRGVGLVRVVDPMNGWTLSLIEKNF